MKAKTEPAKEVRPRGRPAIVEGAETVPITVRLTRPQSEKLQRLGGAKWVRERIERAKEPVLKD